VTVYSRNGFKLDTHERSTWDEVSDLLDNLHNARIRQDNGHVEIMFHSPACLMTPGHNPPCVY
jgi:hypothetical protein